MTYSLPSPQVKGLVELLRDCENAYTSHPEDERLGLAVTHAQVAYYSKLANEKRLLEQKNNVPFDQGTARNASLLAQGYAEHDGIERPPKDVREIQPYVNKHGDIARRMLEEAQRQAA